MKMERIVKNFYAELDNGRIIGRKCKACGAVEFPPRIACTKCGHFETEWYEMSGKGLVTDIVVPGALANAANDIFKPYVIGCVTMEEGPLLNAIVRGISPEQEVAIKKQLPLPVSACICVRSGIKTVIFDVVNR